MRRAAWLGLLVFAHGAAASAADKKAEKKACAEAYEKAQVLMKDSRPSEAREPLAVCARDACPKWIQSDCAKLLADVQDKQPSLVVSAKDGEGHDVRDATVEIDGAAQATHLDGAPIRVEPGDHKVRVVRGDAASEQTVTVRWGDTRRALSFVLEEPKAAPPPAPPAARRGSPVPAIVVGSVGLATLGASIVLGAVTKSDVDGMRAPGGCAPRCAPGDVDAANTRLVVSDVLTVVGIVGVAAGVVMFVLRPKVKEGPAAVTVTTSLGGAGLGLRF